MSNAAPRGDDEELNVKTTNGGVNIAMPNNYSVHLETSVSEPGSSA